MQLLFLSIESILKRCHSRESENPDFLCLLIDSRLRHSGMTDKKKVSQVSQQRPLLRPLLNKEAGR